MVKRIRTVAPEIEVKRKRTINHCFERFKLNSGFAFKGTDIHFWLFFA